MQSSSGTLSCLDLSVCDPSLVLDYEWGVHDDLLGSDHFPVFLKPTSAVPSSSPQHLNYNRANWAIFQYNIQESLSQDEIFQSPDPAEALTNTLITCAKTAIPQTSSKPHLPKTPWFNKDCEIINKKRKSAQRRVFQNPMAITVRAHQRLRAKARYIYKTSRRESWKQFSVPHLTIKHPAVKCGKS